MVHRLALVIGGIGAAALFGLAMVLSNGTLLAANDSSATVDQLVSDPATAATDDAQARVQTLVDTVYVKPARDQQLSADDSGRPQSTSLEPTPAPRADEGRDADHGDRDDDHGDRDDDHGNRGPGGRGGDDDHSGRGGEDHD